jgi:hypothetical protein
VGRTQRAAGFRREEEGGRATGRELKCDRVTRGRDEQEPRKRKPWTRASWRAGENAGRGDISAVVYVNMWASNMKGKS